MNKWVGIGNLTRDPELSTTPSGVSVCKFSIAVNRNYTDANGERGCDFINVVVWRQAGENCAKYLRKGKKVCVVGSIQTRSYENSNGEKRSVVEVVAEDVEFLSPKDDDDRQTQQRPPQRDEQPRRRPAMNSFDDDGDIPF